MCDHFNQCAGRGIYKGFGVITEQICIGCPHTATLLRANNALDESMKVNSPAYYAKIKQLRLFLLQKAGYGNGLLR
jgi:hypothetical protein